MFESHLQDLKSIIVPFELAVALQDEEKRLRDEHISYLEQQKRIEALVKAKLLILEEEAKKRVAWYLKEKRRLIHRSEVKRVNAGVKVG